MHWILTIASFSSLTHLEMTHSTQEEKNNIFINSYNNHLNQTLNNRWKNPKICLTLLQTDIATR